jgi:hypothetical protein
MTRTHTYTILDDDETIEAVFIHKSHSYRGGIIKQSYMLQYLSKTYMFPNCPTPPLKNYINLKGLPNKKFIPCSVIEAFEAEFNKALARESGAQGVLFDEKN